MTTAKFNIYQHVTDTIIGALKDGTLPWRQPWSGGAGLPLPLRANGDRYRGINVLMLAVASMEREYDCRTWMTYKQALDLGGQVRKGEKSTTVVKFGTFQKAGDNDPIAQQDSEGTVRRYARAYRVFNVCQIDGLDDDRYDRPAAPRSFGTKGDPGTDRWFASLGIPIEHSTDPQAYYTPMQDRIHMPDVEIFESASAYYDVLAHECAHAVASKKRLNLKFEGKTAEDRYSREEVFAELSGAMICARLGIPAETDQNAAYIQHWLGLLQEDGNAVFKLASMAQSAADWMFDRAGELNVSKG